MTPRVFAKQSEITDFKTRVMRKLKLSEQEANRQIAEWLGKNERTVRRWTSGQSGMDEVYLVMAEQKLREWR